MADAVLKGPQVIAAHELQADTPKDRPAHPVGEYNGSASCLPKAVLVLPAPGAGAKTLPPKTPAVKDFK